MLDDRGEGESRGWKQLRVTCELCFDFLPDSVLHDVEISVFYWDETTVIRNADIEG